ncbi:MAG: glycosyltransferase family 2 protein [Planctomycetes bacterium]|nr:glycosyltransferase family 2 protein [Planctomycetota bacterium]
MTTPLLSIIVPVFDEARTIDRLLRRVLSVPIDKEVIVVDDGSRDGTSGLLEAWDKTPAIRVFTHDTNRGKGAAIRTGLRYARGEYTIVQDGDLELNPEVYPDLLQPLLERNCDVVVGNRFCPSRQQLRDWFSLHRIGIQAINSWLWLVCGVRLSDHACCYKVLPTEVLRKLELRSTRFDFCAEVLAKAARLNLRIREVPVDYQRRSTAAGKKIRLRDGIEAVYAIWKWRRWQPSSALAENEEASEVSADRADVRVDEQSESPS